MKRLLILIAILLASCSLASAQQIRNITNFDKDWEFSLGEEKKSWRKLDLPHDWSIEGENVESNPGAGKVGYFPSGTGWYRKTFDVKGYSRDKLYSIEFDGVYMNSTVWVNGVCLGTWPYGYSSFSYDLTPVLKAKGNVITVHVDNSKQPNSRWYTGSGIYRHVRLVATDKTHFKKWGVFHYTKSVVEGTATVKVESEIVNESKSQLNAIVRQTIIDKDGNEVARTDKEISLIAGDQLKLNQEVTVADAKLWDTESPYLYTLRSQIIVAGKEKDKVESSLGIRTIEYDIDKGFLLNGKQVKMKGVNLHHDGGAVGAAVPERVWERRIEILKSGGCNAIRTAHNPPAPEFLDLCDKHGMLVMDEAFDQWAAGKNEFDYHIDFDRWHERDLYAMVARDRNHASVVMWSIGNEIPEQWSVQGRQLSRWLQDICHSLDPTRPVTQGMDKAEASLQSGFAQVMDVAGFNYRVHKFDQSIFQLPQRVLLGSESASTVSSRGVYDIYCSSPRETKAVTSGGFPLEGQCSSYDTDFCYWSNLPEADFIMMDDRPWTMGQFVWTGFDYLGEPTPYDEYWPSRSSYFGICDLAGLPKDRYYLYRSQWNRKDHTLHILPHWNWKRGDEVPVMVYTDFPEAELFLNGQSLGRQKKQPYAIPYGTVEHTKKLVETKALLRRYRLIWDAVKYEPGELRVVAYDVEGRPAMEKILHTAGAPAALKLESDRSVIKAGGDDLAFITVSMQDSKGTLCPDASDKVSFNVSGAGTLRGLCNGDPTSLESFLNSEMHLFHGQLVCVVQSSTHPGKIRIDVTSDKITSTIEISVE